MSARTARPYDLGFSTADAEDVRLDFDGADLQLRFVDWRERPVIHRFHDVLAYRWGLDIDPDLRDDQVYEIVDSPWLEREAELAEEPRESYLHLKLAFNAQGVLDVLARR